MLACDTSEAWTQFLDFVKKRCSVAAFGNWLAPIKVVESTTEETTLEVPNIIVQDYLLANYKEDLCAFFPLNANGEPAIRFVIAAAQKGYGALIVVEKDILVDYHIETGTELDSKISAEIIQSIFHPQTPMHDGAIVIRGSKIISAGSFLPLSKNPALDKNLGTRHRAAIGLTEETDALVLVVSEETKSISVVLGGHMYPNAELSEVRQALYEVFGFKYKNYQNESHI